VDYLAILFRWLHMLAAITAVGGTIFMRLALLPAAALLPEAQRTALHQAVRRRWAGFVMASILFLLLSGFYNLIRKLQLPDVPPSYHMLFGIKFILAIVIFFVASALVGRAAAFARMRANAKLWLTVNMVLAVLVVCISGVLRFIPPPETTVPVDAAQELLAP